MLIAMGNCRYTSILNMQWVTLRADSNHFGSSVKISTLSTTGYLHSPGSMYALSFTHLPLR